MRLNARGKAVLVGVHRRIRRAYKRAAKMVLGQTAGVRKSTLPAHRGKHPSGTSRFMPGNIGEYVRSHQLYQLMYTCRWGSGNEARTARLRFAVYEQLELVDRTQFDEMATRALSWLIVCSEVAPASCSSELDIHLLRAPFNRLLPESRATTLSPFHVNGGYATACARTGEIVVYRIEEWFKVFVHETFHAFGLDAGAGSVHLDELSRKLFPVEASHDVREAYTETWARVINVIYCAGGSDSTFIKRCVPLLNLERMFSAVQLGKVLKHMGTHLECIQSESAGQSCGYKEGTNVLSYYILAGALMHDVSGFLSWCAVHASGFLCFRPGPRRESSFAELLYRAVRSPSLVTDVTELGDWSSSESPYTLHTSLRMTILECWEGGTQN